MIDPSRWHQDPPPFKHQIIDVEYLYKNKFYALFNDCGTGKSRTVIDAACELASRNEIDTVIVVCPASVRSVWCDAENGEIKKHTWRGVRVGEFAEGKLRQKWTNSEGNLLNWLITNYEILRSAKHLEFLIGQLKLAEAKTLLVLDESSYIKSRSAKQTKAIMKLRQECERCVILNGTPIVNNPLDLWSQMEVLSPAILKRCFHNYWQFRSEYCETIPQKFHGHSFQKVVRYRRLDDLQKRIAPYCMRRLKTDCLDLPPKLYTTREIALTPESWKRYVMLRNECVIGLEKGELRLEPNAAVRIMRLAQLTSGHLGGVIQRNGDILEDTESNKDYSSEKLDWIVNYLTQECAASHVIVWCRWRRERERLVVELRQSKIESAIFEIYGGQKSSERAKAIQMFSEKTDYKCRKVFVIQQQSGGFGLNLQVASEEWFLSNDWSYGVRAQAEDRAHRSGQVNSLLIGDVLAVGPKGQKTIDHIVLKALRDKADLAAITCEGWRRALTEETA